MDALPCSLPTSSSPSCFRPSLCTLPALAAAPGRPRGMGLRSVVGAASRRDDAYGADSGGWLVDEDMIVLRKRLHEMRVAETNYEPPSHWMEWEKRYYTSYDADVCHLVGLLQAFLMDTRPSVALGLLALIALSVSTSTAVAVLNLVDVVKAVLAGLHLG